MPLKLKIRGNAIIPKLAERANLVVAASNSGTNKQDVSNNVLTTAHRIEEIIIELQNEEEVQEDSQFPIAHWSKTSITATSWVENDEDRYYSSGSKAPPPAEPKRMYKARVDFDVRFRDFAALGDFTAQLSSLEHCEVESTEWCLLPATRQSFQSQLRLKAAQDAMIKVKDYVTALCPGQNVTITPTEFESEYSSSGHRHGRTKQTARKTASKSGDVNFHQGAGGKKLTFTPQEVTMSLDATFVFEVDTPGFKVDSIIADDVDILDEE